MSNEQNLVAEVIVDVPSSTADRPFDYFIPPELAGEVQVGSRVQVPFGPRKLIGYVVDIKENSSAGRLKTVLDVMDLVPPLTPELIQLGLFMANEYLCHTITSLQSMVPAVLKGKYRKIVRLHPSALEQPETLLSISAQALFRYLQEHGECDWEEALQMPHINRSLLRQLAEEKRILVEERVGDRVTRQKSTWVWPKDPDLLPEVLEQLPGRATRQREIIRFFIDHPEEIMLPSLLAQMQTARSTVKKLVEQGWLEWEEREQYRDPYGHHQFQSTQPLPLTAEQQQAFTSILAPLRDRRYQSILLHGVTGSGKTEIYLQAIEEVLHLEREAIVLVPEISLTPQMVQRFKGRFGAKVAVLHSGLSDGERYDEWRKIRSGQVKVAIGARSAIFAPFQNLGLIIIDEEHESSYKQEENPKYHAREIAAWRAEMHGATLVLGSATPAIDTYYLARTGVHEWVTLKERVHGRPFPQVEIVDMRRELRKGNRTMFSTSLRDALIQCVNRGEQAVLFLNRRGFSTFVMCRECGESLMCPHCDISLTYHQTNRTVRCHYCGYAEKVPSECPHCRSRHIRHFGTGTQRVEEELVRRFPGLRVIRMDVDTTSRKGAHEKLLTAFGQGKADVLLGTQMIAKGLDFPKVTLVGVIAADTMLHLPDFRAAERTFQLLTQVSGRAGRHEQPGKVVIQTYSADHYSVEMAATLQVDEFYRQECSIRKQHRYPPFCGMFTLLFSHPDRVLLMKAVQDAAQFIRRHLPADCQLLGPVPAAVPRIKDRFRIQMLIKLQPSSERLAQVKSALKQMDTLFDDKELRISIDREGLELRN
ncbi:primosomal protein N' [Paenactinomyces guangxiensis]|uniref:Replication restart protein PriA n=1 Tax=Paenactinomyces guangxiensis TaxID=1490290 RepID=A0A7W1WQR1_9BACL|nr:primosomal protein N' [Paenactinomyces guangxiensis]MBA4494189.1 primosomal protein N' [Paenactinomyces guangxiensis]MBH8590685.1 primosomal protein N' [Paenactinomyces guangxiensis]